MYKYYEKDGWFVTETTEEGVMYWEKYKYNKYGPILCINSNREKILFIYDKLGQLINTKKTLL